MLATQNILLNLYDIEHLDLSKPWWHQSFVENATVYDKLYHVAGDINLTTVSYRYAIFFLIKLCPTSMSKTPLFAGRRRQVDAR